MTSREHGSRDRRQESFVQRYEYLLIYIAIVTTATLLAFIFAK